MSIVKIEIQERIWNEEKQHYELNYKTFTRDEYGGDFNELVLENLTSYDIKNYAEENCNMIPADEADEHCGCRPSRDPEDFDSEDIVEELERRGYEVVECKTLSDTFKLQKVKELMEL